ncbi:hypothetical protein HOF65_00475 [bacterium]|nr:hypothetical protein [bacterium]MBT3852523.1 hypothetical protein [bacterium]MBT4632688.1 hypothetical protein [bacterium]MBT6778291.1 hypothetical protein [bacterium]
MNRGFIISIFSHFLIFSFFIFFNFSVSSKEIFPMNKSSGFIHFFHFVFINKFISSIALNSHLV